MKSVCSLFIILFSYIQLFGSHNLEVNSGNNANELLCTTYTLSLYDSFGDGWNGATITILNAWNSAVFSGTLANGSVSNQSICLWDGCYTIVVTSGSFPSEISWQISLGIFLFVDGVAPANTSIGFGNLVEGCLDTNACNYNFNANCSSPEDCCYNDCVLIEMFDAEGDGWGGTHLRIYDNLSVLVVDLMMTSGYYSSWTGCLPHDGCYTIQVSNGGGGNGSWDLYYSSTVGAGYDFVMGQPIYGVQYYFSTDGECISGCAHPLACDYDPFVQSQKGYCCFENCATIEMYGDPNVVGWNGAEFILTNWQNEEVARGSLLTDLALGIQNLCLPDGCYTLTVTSANSYHQINWHYTDATGNDLSGIQNSITEIAIGEMIEGCLDHTAVNYNPNANCGSAPCVYTCVSDLDQNGVVNVADLLLFTSDYGEQCN